MRLKPKNHFLIKKKSVVVVDILPTWVNKFVDGKICFSIVRFNLGFLRNSVAEPDILHFYKRKKCVVFFFNVDG